MSGAGGALIVLDRDGVINEIGDGVITEPNDWVPIEGSLEAIARLNQAGFQVAVATNQSGVARGLLDIHQLHAIHLRMLERLNQAGGRIDVLAFCPHSDADGCACRKPSPGLLYTLSERLGIELPGVRVVGDSLRDIQAAMAAAAQPILVRSGNGQRTLDSNKGLEHIPAYDTLAAYVDELLSVPAGTASGRS